MNIAAKTTGPDFLPRIESLRGLAALAVALGHSVMWLTVGGNPRIWEVSFFETSGAVARVVRFLLSIFNGAAAVDVFFVLSGFVLALSLQKARSDWRGAPAFYVRRFFRIYPALVASLALVGGYLMIRSGNRPVFGAASAWFNMWYVDPATLRDYVANLLLRRTELNNVAWTLRIELIQSMIFPALYLICRHGGKGGNVLAGLGTTGLLVFPLFQALRFTLLFFAGIQLCLHGKTIAGWLERRRPTTIVLVILAASFLICGLFSVQHYPVSDLIYTVAAFGLVALCAYAAPGGPFRLLDTPAVRYLGKISYSFYLLHFIVLYALAFEVLARVDEGTLMRHTLAIMFGVGIVSVAAAIPLAAACRAWVERPFIKIGRTLVDRLIHD